jgi:CBS-domain-containing membrane protein
MLAKEIMTSKVISVTPETTVKEIARLLLSHRISAVPVVEAEDRIVGIVGEADLMHRVEMGTERHQAWWSRLLADPQDLAAEYAKSHGVRAADIMSRSVVSVSPETPIGEVAELLERRSLKWIPVVEGQKLVGVISRTDLLRGMAIDQARPETAALDDAAIRERLVQVMQAEGWAAGSYIHVFVENGVVQLWGPVNSDEEDRAVRIAASRVPGVRWVEDHLAKVPVWAWAE